MTFVPVLGTLEVNIRQQLSNEDMINTMYFYAPSGWTLEAMEGFGEAIDEYIVSNYSALHSTASLYRGLRLRNLAAEASDVLMLDTASPVAGSVGGNALPNNVAWTVKFQTGLAGRSYRGRVFHGGISVDMLLTTNTLNGTFATNIRNHYRGISDVGTLNGGTHVVVSRISGGVNRVTGVHTPVTNITYTDTVLDSMRTRLPGRGD